MNVPTRPESHSIGSAAEAAFSLLVAKAGDLWIPTPHGADYGIDGRVEVFEQGHATGAEYGVQVKGSNRFGRNRRHQLIIKGIRRATATYWARRLTPTLLVAYEREDDRLFAAWYHSLVEKDSSSGAPTLRIRLEDASLTVDALANLAEEALRFHRAVVAQVSEPEVSRVLRAFDHGMSEVLDWLHQQVVAFMFHPAGAPHRFAYLGPTDADSTAAALDGSLSPGFDVFPLDLMTILGLWESLVGMTRRVADEVLALLAGQPDPFLAAALDSLASDQRTLIGRSAPGHEAGTPEPGIEWVTVSVPAFFANLTLSIMRGRDFQRRLRWISNADLASADTSGLMKELQVAADAARYIVPAMAWTLGAQEDTRAGSKGGKRNA